MNETRHAAEVQANEQQGGGSRWLDRIERVGNRLPDPVTLFALGTVAVMLLSHLAVTLGWAVELRLPRVDEQGTLSWISTGETFEPRSLLTRDGLNWAVSSLVANFMAFPPLGVVLVGMLGIGVAERTGLIAACLRAFMRIVPLRFLTPVTVFVGVVSSLTLDAGYVVLPPLAAAIYAASGRSPLAGLAAVFAGVSAGFNANLVLTGLDPMLAEFTRTGARIIDNDYHINPACNWYFMIVSTALITLTGWAVTSWFVERRLSLKPADEGGPPTAGQAAGAVAGEDLTAPLTGEQRRGLRWAGVTVAALGAVVAAAILVPGAPLYTYTMPAPNDAEQVITAEVWDGQGERPAAAVEVDDIVLVPSAKPFARWVSAIVPLLFVMFLGAALAYGIAARVIRSDRDVARLMVDAMASMAPIIVLAFVAAQFIEHFRYSGLDRMLAAGGGQLLASAQLSPVLLIVAFIAVTMVFNLFIGSMSAKYALMAPIFVPMLMMVGISPELTQAAYRIGDSATNIITPLNAYLVIVLVFMQRVAPRAGMGTLIATMMPYSIAFALVWTLLLVAWMTLGIPLGPDGPLSYIVGQ